MRNPQENVPRRPFLAHMSLEEDHESQSLIDSTSRYRYERTYSSMEDASAEEGQRDYQQPESSTTTSSESLHEQMQREFDQSQKSSATSNIASSNNPLFGWLFPKKKRNRRRAHRNYNRDEAERLQAQMMMSSTRVNRQTNIVGWLWGLFLLITLGWVCIFTLSEGHIDWAEIINYTPQHPSPALQKKAGIRLLSFFGIGYLLPGVVSLFSLFVGLRLPYIQNNPALSKLVQLPRYGTTYWSVMDLQLLLLFVIVLVGSFAMRFWHKYTQLEDGHWTPVELWKCITKVSGMSLVTILLVVLFPICKTCFWWDVFGLGFDRIIKFHRLLGAFFGVILLLHGLASLVYLDMVNQLYACWTPWSKTCEDSMVTYGWYAGILFVPVFATCFPWIRRNRYEIFYYCHLLVVPALLMAHLHHTNLIYYTSPSLVAYTLDKIVGYFATRRPVQLMDLSVPVEGYTRMTLSVDPKNADFLPGQWIKVKVPAISKWEWHPFSITSAPNQSTITLDIKSMGDAGSWSMKLQKLAKSVASGSDSQSSPTKPDSKRLPSVFLDRYQGCDHTQGFLDHRAVLLVGGGIGITPMMSVLRSLPTTEKTLPHLEHLVFVWVVRNESVVDLYREELARYQSLGCFYRNGQKCKVDILVYVTRPSANGNESSAAMESPRFGSNGGERVDSVRNPVDVTKTYFDPSSAPFSKTVLGHMHHALLMIAVGLGFLRGIVTGSYFADVHGWRQEYAVLVQLGLGFIFSALLGSMVIAGGELVAKSKRPKRQRGVSNPLSMGVDTSMSPLAPRLEMHLGERPNVPQIVAELKQQCLYAGIPSVGVSVCGPDRLTKSVLTNVYEASSPLLEFVMGEESFEW